MCAQHDSACEFVTVHFIPSGFGLVRKCISAQIYTQNELSLHLQGHKTCNLNLWIVTESFKQH